MHQRLFAPGTRAQVKSAALEGRLSTLPAWLDPTAGPDAAIAAATFAAVAERFFSASGTYEFRTNRLRAWKECDGTQWSLSLTRSGTGAVRLDVDIDTAIDALGDTAVRGKRSLRLQCPATVDPDELYAALTESERP